MQTVELENLPSIAVDEGWLVSHPAGVLFFVDTSLKNIREVKRSEFPIRSTQDKPHAKLSIEFDAIIDDDRGKEKTSKLGKTSRSHSSNLGRLISIVARPQPISKMDSAVL